jgi:hypothetical protein
MYYEAPRHGRAVEISVMLAIGPILVAASHPQSKDQYVGIPVMY